MADRSCKTHAHPSSIQDPGYDFKTVWPSGLRRWLKAPVRKGVGSNPTAVTCGWPSTEKLPICSIQRRYGNTDVKKRQQPTIKSHVLSPIDIHTHIHTPRSWIKNWHTQRQRGDSNPCGQSPMDFESISLATRTHCHVDLRTCGCRCDQQRPLRANADGVSPCPHKPCPHTPSSLAGSYPELEGWWPACLHPAWLSWAQRQFARVV